MASEPSNLSDAWRSRTAPFRVSGFVVDPARNVVIRDDGEEAIEPRIMDVLCFLADNAGKVVPREDIIDAVWGRRFGGDESLTRAISRLRKAFWDTRSPPRVIETISKRGYRLVAAVSLDAERADASSGAPRERSLLPRYRVFAALAVVTLSLIVAWALALRREPSADGAITVVIPNFSTLGPGLDGRGALLADRIAGSLSRSSLLMPRRTVASGPSGRAQYVYTVRGALQRLEPDRLRLTVQLDDAATRDTLWSGVFDRPHASALEAGDDLTAATAAELNNHILNAAKAKIRAKPLTTLAPWELVLLATWVPGSDEVFLAPHGPDADWLQQRALAIDPNYAPAHASLASALAYRALFTPNLDAAALRRSASEHAQKARALAPYDVGVLYELATYHRLIGDRKGALALLDRVLALQPSHPVARYDRLFVAGLCTSAGADATVSLERELSGLAADNPVRWVVLSHIADLELGDGDVGRAAYAAERSRQIVPMTWSGVTLAAAAAAQGRATDARQASAETLREWPSLDWGWFAHEGVPLWCLQGPRQRHAADAFLKLDDVVARGPKPRA